MTQEFFLDSSVRRPQNTSPLIIVQARMGSTRLPGKILKKIHNKPLLQILLERLLFVEKPVSLLVATTDQRRDDVTVDCVRGVGVDYFRGNENDVLDRYYKAFKGKNVDAIVRITADCPLMDPTLVSQALNLFYALSVDYLSNTLRRTYPRGFDIEIIKPSALSKAAIEATTPYEREHVTPYIINHKDLFTHANFICDCDLSQWSVTVDTQEDFNFVEKIVSFLGSSFQTCSFTTIRKLMSEPPTP